MYHFTFNGINSKEYGITVGTRPDLTSVNQRVDRLKLPGMDGEYIEELGADIYNVSFPIYIEDKDNIDEIKGWLLGEGVLQRSDRPGQQIKVHFNNLVQFKYLIDDLYEATVTYDVIGAYWEKIDDPFKTITDNINSEGNTVARPIIRLTKETSEEGDIIINDVRFLYEFKSNDEYLEINSEDQEVRDEVGALRNRSITIGYKFPEIKPGDNPVTIKSGDAKIEVRRKDRWK